MKPHIEQMNKVSVVILDYLYKHLVKEKAALTFKKNIGNLIILDGNHGPILDVGEPLISEIWIQSDGTTEVYTRDYTEVPEHGHELTELLQPLLK